MRQFLFQTIKFSWRATGFFVAMVSVAALFSATLYLYAHPADLGTPVVIAGIDVANPYVTPSGSRPDLDNCSGGPFGQTCKDQYGIQVSCSNPDQADADLDLIGNICDPVFNSPVANPCGDSVCAVGEVCAVDCLTETNCFDGVSNDGDAQVDCLDSDCASQVNGSTICCVDATGRNSTLCPAGQACNVSGQCETACGDGHKSFPEACDNSDPILANQCPVGCDDGNSCTNDQLVGSAANCTAQCVHNPISACANGDSCCPGSCNIGNDNDCPAVALCSNGSDDDGDGQTDWPSDPGCSSANDNDEHGTTQCDNTIDDDNDLKIDFKSDGSGDTGCTGPADDIEADCGDHFCNGSETPSSCSADCGPSTETGFCADRSDNDNDGPFDCADSDCQTDPACLAVTPYLWLDTSEGLVSKLSQIVLLENFVPNPAGGGFYPVGARLHRYGVCSTGSTPNFSYTLTDYMAPPFACPIGSSAVWPLVTGTVINPLAHEVWWVVKEPSNSWALLIQFSFDGTMIKTCPIAASSITFALDRNGDIWVAEGSANQVVKIAHSGSNCTPAVVFSYSSPTVLAPTISGNLWVVGSGVSAANGIDYVINPESAARTIARVPGTPLIGSFPSVVSDVNDDAMVVTSNRLLKITHGSSPVIASSILAGDNAVIGIDKSHIFWSVLNTGSDITTPEPVKKFLFPVQNLSDSHVLWTNVMTADSDGNVWACIEHTRQCCGFTSAWQFKSCIVPTTSGDRTWYFRDRSNDPTGIRSLIISGAL